MTAKVTEFKTQAEILKEAMDDLQSLEMSRAALDPRKQAFSKCFKVLNPEERGELCKQSALLMRDKYISGRAVDGILFSLVRSFASEKDSVCLRIFLNSIVESSSDSEYFREIALALLDIADNELTHSNSKIPIGQAALVCLTEFGLSLAALGGQSKLDIQGSSRVVEYITSSLLARSNMNSSAMRMSLVYYLSRAGNGNQASMQLNRVISRFGQSLLDELLTAFFSDKKRENAAFYFLLEHLNSFFTSSPGLAAMSHSVLRHFMLKFPAEFPGFCAAYAEFVPRNESHLRNTTKHFALLLRASLDVSQRQLSENLFSILHKHLQVFQTSPGGLLAQETALVVQILTAGHVGRTMKPISDDMVKALNQLVQPTQGRRDNVFDLFRPKKGRDSSARIARFAAEPPSPLESMLLLAS